MPDPQLQIGQLLDEVVYQQDDLQVGQVLDEVVYLASEGNLLVGQVLDEVVYIEGAVVLEKDLTLRVNLFEVLEKDFTLRVNLAAPTRNKDLTLRVNLAVPIRDKDLTLRVNLAELRNKDLTLRVNLYFAEAAAGWFYDTLRDWTLPATPGTRGLPDWDAPEWSGSTASPIVLKVWTNQPTVGKAEVIPMPLYGKPLRTSFTFTEAGSDEWSVIVPGIYNIEGNLIPDSQSFGGLVSFLVQKESSASTVTVTVWSQTLTGEALPLKQVVLTTETMKVFTLEGQFYGGIALSADSDAAESVEIVGVFQ